MTTSIPAIGEGRGRGWAAAALLVSLVCVGAQVLVVVGRREPPLPGMRATSTRSGAIALLTFYGALSSFPLIAVIFDL